MDGGYNLLDILQTYYSSITIIQYSGLYIIFFKTVEMTVFHPNNNTLTQKK